MEGTNHIPINDHTILTLKGKKIQANEVYVWKFEKDPEKEVLLFKDNFKDRDLNGILFSFVIKTILNFNELIKSNYRSSNANNNGTPNNNGNGGGNTNNNTTPNAIPNKTSAYSLYLECVMEREDPSENNESKTMKNKHMMQTMEKYNLWKMERIDYEIERMRLDFTKHNVLQYRLWFFVHGAELNYAKVVEDLILGNETVISRAAKSRIAFGRGSDTSNRFDKSKLWSSVTMDIWLQILDHYMGTNYYCSPEKSQIFSTTRIGSIPKDHDMHPLKVFNPSTAFKRIRRNARVEQYEIDLYLMENKKETKKNKTQRRHKSKTNHHHHKKRRSSSSSSEDEDSSNEDTEEEEEEEEEEDNNEDKTIDRLTYMANKSINDLANNLDFEKFETLDRQKRKQLEKNKTSKKSRESSVSKGKKEHKESSSKKKRDFLFDDDALIESDGSSSEEDKKREDSDDDDNDEEINEENIIDFSSDNEEENGVRRRMIHVQRERSFSQSPSPSPSQQKSNGKVGDFYRPLLPSSNRGEGTPGSRSSHSNHRTTATAVVSNRNPVKKVWDFPCKGSVLKLTPISLGNLENCLTPEYMCNSSLNIRNRFLNQIRHLGLYNSEEEEEDEDYDSEDDDEGGSQPSKPSIYDKKSKTRTIEYEDEDEEASVENFDYTTRAINEAMGTNIKYGREFIDDVCDIRMLNANPRNKKAPYIVLPDRDESPLPSSSSSSSAYNRNNNRPSMSRSASPFSGYGSNSSDSYKKSHHKKKPQRSVFNNSNIFDSHNGMGGGGGGGGGVSGQNNANDNDLPEGSVITVVYETDYDRLHEISVAYKDKLARETNRSVFRREYMIYQQWAHEQFKEINRNPSSDIGDAGKKLLRGVIDEGIDRVKTRHSVLDPNMSIFSGYIQRMMESFEQLLFFLRAHRHFLVLVIGTLDAYRESKDLKMNYLLSGKSGSTKSYMIDTLESTKIRGTIFPITFSTAKAFTAQNHRTDLITVYHEFNLAPLSRDQSEKTPEANIMKDKLSRLRVTTHTLDIINGKRISKTIDSKQQECFIFATNQDYDNLDEAFLSRVYVILCMTNSRIDRDATSLSDIVNKLTPEQNKLIELFFKERKREQWIHYEVNKAIHCGVLTPPDLAISDYLLTKISNELAKKKKVSMHPRTMKQMRIMIMNLIICVATEYIYNINVKIYDVQRGDYVQNLYGKAFNEDHIPIFDPYLHDELEIVIFVVGLFSEQFESPIARDISKCLLHLNETDDNMTDNGEFRFLRVIDPNYQPPSSSSSTNNNNNNNQMGDVSSQQPEFLVPSHIEMQSSSQNANNTPVRNNNNNLGSRPNVVRVSEMNNGPLNHRNGYNNNNNNSSDSNFDKARLKNDYAYILVYKSLKQTTDEILIESMAQNIIAMWDSNIPMPSPVHIKSYLKALKKKMITSHGYSFEFIKDPSPSRPPNALLEIPVEDMSQPITTRPSILIKNNRVYMHSGMFYHGFKSVGGGNNNSTTAAGVNNSNSTRSSYDEPIKEITLKMIVQECCQHHYTVPSKKIWGEIISSDLPQLFQVMNLEAVEDKPCQIFNPVFMNPLSRKLVGHKDLGGEERGRNSQQKYRRKNASDPNNRKRVRKNRSSSSSSNQNDDRKITHFLNIDDDSYSIARRLDSLGIKLDQKVVWAFHPLRMMFDLMKEITIDTEEEDEKGDVVFYNYPDDYIRMQTILRSEITNLKSLDSIESIKKNNPELLYTNCYESQFTEDSDDEENDDDDYDSNSEEDEEEEGEVEGLSQNQRRNTKNKNKKRGLYDINHGTFYAKRLLSKPGDPVGPNGDTTDYIHSHFSYKNIFGDRTRAKAFIEESKKNYQDIMEKIQEAMQNQLNTTPSSFSSSSSREKRQRIGNETSDVDSIQDLRTEEDSFYSPEENLYSNHGSNITRVVAQAIRSMDMEASEPQIRETLSMIYNNNHDNSNHTTERQRTSAVPHSTRRDSINKSRQDEQKKKRSYANSNANKRYLESGRATRNTSPRSRNKPDKGFKWTSTSYGNQERPKMTALY